MGGGARLPVGCERVRTVGGEYGHVEVAPWVMAQPAAEAEEDEDEDEE